MSLKLEKVDKMAKNEDFDVLNQIWKLLSEH